MATKTAAGFNFGDLNAYSSGGGIPEGDYILKNFEVKMYTFTKQDGSSAGQPRLGVMITMAPIGGGDDREQFYSMGSNADKSWVPNDTGKGINPVAGGPGTPPNMSTNWAFFVKSLFDAGLPQGILGDDLSVLEGTWVHMFNAPEPEERKGFQAKTGEAAEQRKANTIPAVSEIKEDGKPWEGTGGVPDAPAPAKTAPKAAPTAAATKATPKPAAPAAPSNTGNEDVLAAAESALGTVLSAAPKGGPKLLIKTSVFKAVADSYEDKNEGLKMARAVQDAFWTTDDNINKLLSAQGYVLTGGTIKPA